MPETGITGVVLAGGQSRRMGAEKSLLTLRGRPLWMHVAERLAPQVDRVILNANGDPCRFAAPDVPIVADTLPGYVGPLAGVLAALRWVRAHAPDASAIVTVPADTPFIPGDLVARLVQTGVTQRIVVAASGGRLHPVVALWPRRVEDDLARDLTVEHPSVMGWVMRREHAVAAFSCEEGRDPFLNINTPEDLAFAEGS